MQQLKVPNVRWWRIVAVAFLLYSIAYMDRVNLGFGFAGMQKSLGFDATMAGLAGSIFFTGYFLLNIAGGQIVQKWSIKKFVFIACFVWAAFAMATGLVHNVTQLLIVRFLLGVAEGGVYPAMMVLISNWFPASERGRAMSYFILCVPFGSMFISPISGLILDHATWRELFLIEGAFPIVWAIIWWFAIADHPNDAKWLSNEERAYLKEGFDLEKVQVQTQAATIGEALRNRNVLLMIVVYFFLQVGLNGIGLWLPTIVQTIAGGSPTRVGFLSALPWLAAIIGLIINGRHSDKTGDRKYHVAIPVIIGGVFLLVSTLLGKENPLPSMIALIFSVGFFQSFNGVVWTIPSEIVDSRILGLVVGVINGCGTLGGGFVGPLIVGYLKDLTHGIVAGEIFLVISVILAGIFVTFIKTTRKTVHSFSDSTNKTINK